MRAGIVAIILILLTLPATAQVSPPIPANPDTTIKDYLLSIINERDRLYNGRIDALDNKVLQKFESVEKSLSAAIGNQALAVQKAETAAEKRFDSVNEFRNQLKDQQVTLVTRSEIDARFKSLEEKIALIVSYQNQASGRGQNAEFLWSALIAVAGLAVAGIVAFRSRVVQTK